jgi:hypothetical protein
MNLVEILYLFMGVVLAMKHYCAVMLVQLLLQQCLFPIQKFDVYYLLFHCLRDGSRGTETTMHLVHTPSLFL